MKVLVLNYCLIFLPKLVPNDYVTLHYDLTESGDYISNEGLGKSIRINLSNSGENCINSDSN